MKKINRKRLNNKGFTLIELLAVVVILAVVMGIAMTSVLSSMNKARAGSLEDSTLTIVSGFNQKYLEAMIDGVPTDVYGDVLGSTEGYNFSTDSIYYLNSGLKDELNISNGTYRLADSGSALTATNGVYQADKSFVVFDAEKEKFVVCLIANNSGNNFVTNNAISYATTDTKEKAKITGVTINGLNVSFVADDSETNVMYACSDGTRSW